MKNILICVAMILYLFANATFSQTIKKKSIEWKGKNTEVVDGEVSIKIKENISFSDHIKEIESLGIEILDSSDDMGMVRLKIPKGMEIIEAIEKLSNINFAEKISPIAVTNAFVTPTDTYYSSNQWGLPKVGATSAWDITTGSSTITIGVLDSGIPIQNNSLSHPDLQNTSRILLGSDYIGDGSGVKDKNGHGTHVAGIASAETNNSIGVSGMSWNTKLFIVQVFDTLGNGSAYTFYQGVRNAVDNGVKVINFSGGGMSDDQYFENAIIYARNNGVLLVIAAGNYHSTDNPNKIVEYPAVYSTEYDNVIAVSATTSNDVIADFSSRGSEVTVSAPGNYIYSTLPNYQVNKNISPYNCSQNYDNLSGTSMAAPFVAGLAGLVFSKYSSLTPAQVREAIKLSALDLGTTGFDNLYGYGRIDADKALHNLYVPQVFSTIQSAISAASSGQTVYVSGTQTLSGDISVPSGVSLNITSGTTVNLVNGSNLYSIISSGGTITNNGTISGLRAKLGSTGQYGLCGSIQTAINYSSYNNNIYIQSGTFSESFSVANKSSIIYIYGDGQTSSYINGNISVTNSYYPQIYDLTTRYLSISSCNNPRVSEVTVVPWAEDSDGSLFSNSNTNLYLIDVTLNNTPDSYGAYFSGSSGQVYPVNGTYFENNQLATYFINSSSFTLSNVHFCENDYDISTDASSSVLAQNVTFSGDPANTTVGNVSYGSYSTCSLGKTSSIASYEDNKKDFGYDEFQKLNVIYQDLLGKINSEKVEEYNITKGKYISGIKKVVEQCKSFVDKNPTSCFAPAAISLASHSYKQIEDYEGMKTFVSGIMEDKDLLNLYNNAKRSLIDYYNYKEDYEKSLSIADEILNSKPSDENLICDLLLSKGLMYEYRMGKKEEAIKQYELMISGYPQSGITKFAKKQLENLGINEDYEIPKETTELTEIAEFESSNYPNPFNPTTTISYTLPEAGAVQIKIYDVLGREVAKLVDEQKSAGKYTVQWNGSNYASGIYFYSVTFGGQRLYKKMLMIK